MYGAGVDIGGFGLVDNKLSETSSFGVSQEGKSKKAKI